MIDPAATITRSPTAASGRASVVAAQAALGQDDGLQTLQGDHLAGERHAHQAVAVERSPVVDGVIG